MRPSFPNFQSVVKPRPVICDAASNVTASGARPVTSGQIVAMLASSLRETRMRVIERTIRRRILVSAQLGLTEISGFRVTRLRGIALSSDPVAFLPLLEFDTASFLPAVPQLHAQDVVFDQDFFAALRHVRLFLEQFPCLLCVLFSRSVVVCRRTYLHLPRLQPSSACRSRRSCASFCDIHFRRSLRWARLARASFRISVGGRRDKRALSALAPSRNAASVKF
jgi:hypothetical protein